MRRVGLVGFGSIAEHGHLPAWSALSGFEVTAIADLSPGRLERARMLAPSAKLYESPMELITRAEVDVIDICSPPISHRDLLIAACAGGVGAVVCEKPLVLEEEDFLAVAEAQRRSGCRLASINNWIHSDLYVKVRAALAEGLIGQITGVVLRTNRPDCALGNVGWNPRWRTDRDVSGGGIVLDHGWHQLYLLHGWIDQPIEHVQAITRTSDPRHAPVEDEAIVDLRFLTAEARIELSWTAEARANEGWIRGTHGRIRVEDDRIVIDGRTGRQERRFRGKLTESSYHPDWFEKVFRYNVVDRNRGEADRNFAEAGVLVSTIAAIYRSAALRGRAVSPALPSVEVVRATVAEREGVVDVCDSEGAAAR